MTPLARDDAGRMMSGELVYTGVERTPVAAIVRSLPHRGMRRVVASERFAESRDVWLLLGELAEAADSGETADGGPATRDAARVRLARSMLVEPAAVSADDARAAAEWCAEIQARLDRRGPSPACAAAADRGRGRSCSRATAAASHGGGTDGLGCRHRQPVRRAGAVCVARAPAHALALIARGNCRDDSMADGAAPPRARRHAGERGWVVKVGGSLLVRPVWPADLRDLLRRRVRPA